MHLVSFNKFYSSPIFCVNPSWLYDYYIPSPWRVFFNICCDESLLIMNSFSFCLSEKMFLLILKDMFYGIKFWVNHFVLSAIKMPLYFFIAWIMSDKSAINFIYFFLSRDYLFFLSSCPPDFLLYFFSGVLLLMYICMYVCLTTWDFLRLLDLWFEASFLLILLE